MRVEYTVNKKIAEINFAEDALACIQMRFSPEKILHGGPYANNCNRFGDNIAVQHMVAIVLHAAVAPIPGLSGTLSMCDRSKLRHDCVAVVSEDTILPLPFHTYLLLLSFSQ